MSGKRKKSWDKILFVCVCSFTNNIIHECLCNFYLSFTKLNIVNNNKTPRNVLCKKDYIRFFFVKMAFDLYLSLAPICFLITSRQKKSSQNTNFKYWETEVITPPKNWYSTSNVWVKKNPNQITKENTRKQKNDYKTVHCLALNFSWVRVTNWRQMKHITKWAERKRQQKTGSCFFLDWNCLFCILYNFAIVILQNREFSLIMWQEKK